MSIVLASAVLALALAVTVAVLVRRDRRRLPGGPDTGRLETAAGRGLRDARSRVRAARHFAASDGLAGLRDRDGHGH